MHSPPLPPDARASGPSKGWKFVGQVKGVFLILTVVAMALVALFVDFVLEPTLREQRVEMTPVAELFFKAPWLVAVLSIPAVATAMPLFLGTRRVFLWITISSILLLVPFGFFLLATVGSIAKIYSDALNM